MRAVATLVPLLFVVALARPATAQPPLEAARGLLAAWHDDPARIDRARVLLEAEAAADPSADTLVELSRDRKSTRLNSSHGYISYAVFCLKKKKKKHDEHWTRDHQGQVRRRVCA